MATVRRIKGREGYYLDYRLRDGTRVVKKAARNTKRGAERELALTVAEIETRPGLKKLKKMTFGKMCEEYLENFAKPNHRDWKGDEYKLKGLKTHFQPESWLKHITTREIERFKAERFRNVKPATVNRDLALLKHMMKTAIDWGYLFENPAKL